MRGCKELGKTKPNRFFLKKTNQTVGLLSFLGGNGGGVLHFSFVWEGGKVSEKDLEYLNHERKVQIQVQMFVFIKQFQRNSPSVIQVLMTHLPSTKTSIWRAAHIHW